MTNLSTLTKTPLGVWALMALMLVTRFHHFGSAIALPDASLAVFFMAGLWFGRLPLLTILLVEAAIIDYVAIAHMGVNDYCISPAYGFLIPAYAALFYAGRLASRFRTQQASELLLQISLLVISTSAAFVIANGSFYLFSGRFAELNWLDYAGRVAQFYPSYLTAALIYYLVIVGLVKLMASLGYAQNLSNKVG